MIIDLSGDHLTQPAGSAGKESNTGRRWRYMRQTIFSLFSLELRGGQQYEQRRHQQQKQYRRSWLSKFRL